MTTPTNSSSTNSSPMGCMHNGLENTSKWDVIEHIMEREVGKAFRDVVDPHSPNEVNFGNRTIEQTNTSDTKEKS